MRGRNKFILFFVFSGGKSNGVESESGSDYPKTGRWENEDIQEKNREEKEDGRESLSERHRYLVLLA